jgi:hypothetical protein
VVHAVASVSIEHTCSAVLVCTSLLAACLMGSGKLSVPEVLRVYNPLKQACCGYTVQELMWLN